MPCDQRSFLSSIALRTRGSCPRRWTCAPAAPRGRFRRGPVRQSRELFVIQRRIRSHHADRRPRSRLRTFQVFIGEIVHLPKSGPISAKGPADRAVLKWVETFPTQFVTTIAPTVHG